MGRGECPKGRGECPKGEVTSCPAGCGAAPPMGGATAAFTKWEGGAAFPKREGEGGAVFPKGEGGAVYPGPCPGDGAAAPVCRVFSGCRTRGLVDVAVLPLYVCMRVDKIGIIQTLAMAIHDNFSKLCITSFANLGPKMLGHRTGQTTSGL